MLQLSRTVWVALALAGVIGSFSLPILMPAPMTITKTAWLGSMGVAWVALVRLAWSRPAARWTLLGLPILAVTPLALPGRAIDATELREIYVDRLLAFEGTEYVWGGDHPGRPYQPQRLAQIRRDPPPMEPVAHGLLNERWDEPPGKPGGWRP